MENGTHEKVLTQATVRNWTELFDRDIYVAWIDAGYSDGTGGEIRIGFSLEYTVNNGGLDKLKTDMQSPAFVSGLLDKSAAGHPGFSTEGGMLLVGAEGRTP